MTDNQKMVAFLIVLTFVFFVVILLEPMDISERTSPSENEMFFSVSSDERDYDPAVEDNNEQFWRNDEEDNLS